MRTERGLSRVSRGKALITSGEGSEEDIPLPEVDAVDLLSAVQPGLTGQLAFEDLVLLA